MKTRSLDLPITPVFVAPGYTPITSIPKWCVSTYPLDTRVIQAICDRVDGFGIQDMKLWRRIFDHVYFIMRRGFPEFVDKRNADMMLADGVWCVRNLHDSENLTAEQHYELERWIDYLPDAYAAICKTREKPRRGRKSRREMDDARIDGARYAEKYA